MTDPIESRGAGCLYPHYLEAGTPHSSPQVTSADALTVPSQSQPRPAQLDGLGRRPTYPHFAPEGTIGAAAHSEFESSGSVPAPPWPMLSARDPFLPGIAEHSQQQSLVGPGTQMLLDPRLLADDLATMSGQPRNDTSEHVQAGLHPFAVEPADYMEMCDAAESGQGMDWMLSTDWTQGPGNQETAAPFAPALPLTCSSPARFADDNEMDHFFASGSGAHSQQQSVVSPGTQMLLDPRLLAGDLATMSGQPGTDRSEHVQAGLHPFAVEPTDYPMGEQGMDGEMLSTDLTQNDVHSGNQEMRAAFVPTLPLARLSPGPTALARFANDNTLINHFFAVSIRNRTLHNHRRCLERLAKFISSCKSPEQPYSTLVDLYEHLRLQPSHAPAKDPCVRAFLSSESKPAYIAVSMVPAVAAMVRALRRSREVEQWIDTRLPQTLSKLTRNCYLDYLQELAIFLSVVHVDENGLPRCTFAKLCDELSNNELSKEQLTAKSNELLSKNTYLQAFRSWVGTETTVSRSIGAALINLLSRRQPREIRGVDEGDNILIESVRQAKGIGKGTMNAYLKALRSISIILHTKYLDTDGNRQLTLRDLYDQLRTLVPTITTKLILANEHVKAIRSFLKSGTERSHLAAALYLLVCRTTPGRPPAKQVLSRGAPDRSERRPRRLLGPKTKSTSR